MEGVVRIWDYGDGGPLELMTRRSWIPEEGGDTYFHCVDVGNVMEGTGSKIVVGGYALLPASSSKIVVVFESDGMSWEVNTSHRWNDDRSGKVNEIRASDVDGDGAVEMITAGSHYTPASDVWANFEMIVWHLGYDLIDPTVEEPPRRIFWPPGAFVDTLPIVWRYIIYTVASVIAVAFVVVALRGVFSLLRKGSGRGAGPME